MSLSYTVSQNEYLGSIAKKFGLKSWKDIYYHPDNAAFRAKRPDPDKIFPGDVVMIPQLKQGAGPPEGVEICRYPARAGSRKEPISSSPKLTENLQTGPKSPKDYAFLQVPRASQMIQMSINAIDTAISNGYKRANPHIRLALETHFQMHKWKTWPTAVDAKRTERREENALLQIRDRFLRTSYVLLSAATIFVDAGDYDNSRAIWAVTRSLNMKGANMDLYVQIHFTKRFMSAGDLVQAMTVIHECSHAADGYIDDWAAQTPRPFGTPMDSPHNYKSLDPQEAAGNAYSYEQFALHVFEGFDKDV